VEGFKGPLDLDNRNGNFGTTFALNAGVPVAKRLGIGMQGGVSAVLTDFHGTEFTGDTIRVQDFITVGVFQRISRGGPNSLNWGFTYDWMADRYYSSMYMSQWRVQISYELNPFCEIGLWACIPDEGDFARVGSERFGYTTENFKPLPQGNFFIRRRWMNNFTATAWMGIIEEPGELVFGGDARVPISRHLSFVGSFNYVLPSANGAPGQDEEMWYVSVGIELAPFATGCRAFDEKFRPLFPLANNGTFSIRRF